MPTRPAVGRAPPAMSAEPLRLRVVKPDDKYLTDRLISTNICAVSRKDFAANQEETDLYLIIDGLYVVSAHPFDNYPPGCIYLNDRQRTWCGVGVQQGLTAELYNPFAQGSRAYLHSLDVEIGFASLRNLPTDPLDQDVLADAFIKQYENHVFAPGQLLLLNHGNVKFSIKIKTIQLHDLRMEGPSAPSQPLTDKTARGILTKQSSITFYKDATSPIKLKGSSRRPAANSIIAPDFKFENMGIGGLDAEFSSIFRRAFASRIFPPGMIEKLGIQHVKGILLYGPPGTGKTLIARQIGKMLNSREPKVINGPEVLNKYVGQSEENIRKLFADAEKEYKEKGDESGLHIIIFDELDAVCKQRGSGAGGGTGVGDSVVNQLLSKLDGVDQLNNILLIGMTNRMDLIDDALLRPGRLEVHMEISLPDEGGRAQILKIHTSKMRENNVMDKDVDVQELAGLTKNFSGAEIGGLVKSASSFAFNRHVKVGTVAGVADDIETMKVNRGDFMKALDEVKPAFGVSEEELENAIDRGILQYSNSIPRILNDGRSFVTQIRNSPTTSLLSVLLYGPPGSGKTALAAAIAKASKFPFIKLASAENMVGFNDMAKIQYLNKIFTDAYKSPQNIVVVDNIERIIEWVPIGPRFSNPVLQALMVLLTKKPPHGRRLLILGTTSQYTVMRNLDLQSIFNYELEVPSVSTLRELEDVLRETQAFDNEQDLNLALRRLEDARGDDRVGVGIKQVLLGIERAKEDAIDMPERLADIISQQIAANSDYPQDGVRVPPQPAATDKPRLQGIDRPRLKGREDVYGEEFGEEQDEYQ